MRGKAPLFLKEPHVRHALILILILSKMLLAAPDSAEDQVKTFTVAPGFSIELVAADPDFQKVVDIAFDDAGRMWAVTAVEYPVDGNENPAAAKLLFEKGGRDKVLVFDNIYAGGRAKPRIFAEGLSMPMAVMPLKNGVLIGHGPEILWLEDTDGDGKADKREVVLSGFGIQDSHLMPHRFVRGPGEWIYMAQGAFNNSNVKAKDGKTTSFNQCKVGRFKADGSVFEVAGVGLNNIWGFVIDRQGEYFIQEANDMGYPLVPFYLGASYPGIGNHKVKPYSPWQPSLAKFQMGGTGLSGLALSDDRSGGYPAPYNTAIFLANPITRCIQAVNVLKEGGGHKLEKLPDFITSKDEWFRPIAIHFGPDGCLYIVDWYNKIISHNEVPRNHPDRDRTRSRIWRVRANNVKPAEVPNVVAAPEASMLKMLFGPSNWQARAAWRQITDRKMSTLLPQLLAVVEDTAKPVDERILALWSAENLQKLDPVLLARLSKESQRTIRREAVRVMGEQALPSMVVLPILQPLAEDRDFQVRTEVIRTLEKLEPGTETVELLVRMIRDVPQGPETKKKAEPAAVEAANIEFERSLIRSALEKNAQPLAAFMDSPKAQALPLENRMFAALALDAKVAASRIAAAVPQLKRPLSNDEVVLLAQNAGDPAIAAVFSAQLKNEAAQVQMLQLMLQLKDRLQIPEVTTQIAAAASAMLKRDGGEGNHELLVKLTAAFRTKELEPEVLAFMKREGLSKTRQLLGLKALREINAVQPDLFHQLALSSSGDDMQREAVGALASLKNDRANALLMELWPSLPPAMRKIAVDRLTSSAEGGRALLGAIKSNAIRRDEIDGYALDKLKTVLGDDAELAALMQKWAGKMKKVLRLSGGVDDYADTKIELKDAFTIETWVKFDAGLGNMDSLLGAPKGPSFNFYDSKLRAYWGEDGDMIVAPKPTPTEAWTHLAITRNADGAFKLYVNGALEADKSKTSKRNFPGLDVGRSSVATGTAALMTEFRVWNIERSADEIWDTWNRSLQDEPRPAALTHYFATPESWGKLHGTAKLESTMDLPPLVSATEARELKEKFETMRKRAEAPGDVTQGKAIFTKMCMQCHKVGNEGAEIGPPLSGAGAMGTEALLRAMLTPSAAVEAGYRSFRVETRDNEIIEGFMLTNDKDSVVIRQPNRENQIVPRAKVKRAAFTAMSIMPEGQLEALKPEEVSHLFTYLKTLK